jgi:hypothetical protein
MAIVVVCPGCRKSYEVSDKFAGKSGPCPKCKQILQVPALSEQVQVHTPTEFASGGRNASGKLDLKPITHTDAKLQPLATTIIVAAALATLFAAWAGGNRGMFDAFWASAVSLFVVSPPLVVAAYAIVRNDELEPYRGKSLCFRAAVCAGGYVVLWGLFSWLAAHGVITGDVWVWVFVGPSFLAVGGLVAMATLDLAFGDALFHYGFYILATVILRWAAGMKWVWDVSR